MKIKVQFCDDDGEGGGPIYEYEMDYDKELGEHLCTLCAMYSLPEGMYSLQAAESGTYLFDDDEVPLHEQLDGLSGALIFLRVAPQARAEACFDLLDQTDEQVIGFFSFLFEMPLLTPLHSDSEERAFPDAV